MKFFKSLSQLLIAALVDIEKKLFIFSLELVDSNEYLTFQLSFVFSDDFRRKFEDENHWTNDCAH